MNINVMFYPSAAPAASPPPDPSYLATGAARLEIGVPDLLSIQRGLSVSTTSRGEGMTGIP